MKERMSALREVSNLTNVTGADVKSRQASRAAAAAAAAAQAAAASASSSGLYNTSLPARNTTLSFASSTASIAESSHAGTLTSGSYLLPPPPPPTSQQQQPSTQQQPLSSLPPNRSRRSFSYSRKLSPKYEEHHRDEPTYCSDLIQDITEMFLERERQAVRRFNEGIAAYDSNTGTLHSYYPSPHYLQYQPEINEKMRVILLDWLIDVHIKFKLHPETMYLAVNLVDRYMSCVNTKFSSHSYVPRSKLQLVGVCAMLLAAKYEEIWPPEVKECVHISANTYTKEEIIEMERDICAALCFRLTVPTAYQFATRLLTVLDGDDFLDCGADEALRTEQFTLLRYCSHFFMEHALLDYKCLQFTPSQVGNASVFLALVTVRIKYALPQPACVWTEALQFHSKSDVNTFRDCALAILNFVNYIPTIKYQALRRKYNSSRYGEVTKCMMPNDLPLR